MMRRAPGRQRGKSSPGALSRSQPPRRATVAPVSGGSGSQGHDVARVPVRAPSPVVASSSSGASFSGVASSSQSAPGFDVAKRARLDALLRSRPRPLPVIGVSNRPAFGYDSSALGSRLATGRSLMQPVSLPGGFEPLGRDASKRDEAVRKAEVQEARGRRLVPLRERGAVAELGSGEERESDRLDLHERARAELDAVSGLYIGGGQDFDPEDQPTRLPYERALIREARNRGMPTLAICGGSRVLAQEFGGCAVDLPPESRGLHQRHKTQIPAHGLTFPSPAAVVEENEAEPRVWRTAGSILGGAAPERPPGETRSIDAINSTHEKVVGHAGGELSPINQLPGVRTGPRSELMISALGPDGHPEGFETRHGAPIVGVTSHPEAIFGTRGAREEASAQGRGWSDRVLAGFAQAADAYAARQEVNRELRARIRRELPAAESHPGVTLAPGLAEEMAASRRDDLRQGRPEIQFGAPLSKWRDRDFKDPGRL